MENGGDGMAADETRRRRQFFRQGIWRHGGGYGFEMLGHDGSGGLGKARARQKIGIEDDAGLGCEAPGLRHDFIGKAA